MANDNNVSIVGQACTGCAACADACPVEAIGMRRDEEGFARPSVNVDACIDCGKCLTVCPARTRCAAVHISRMLAAFCNDKSLRQNSSSGGIFAECARHVINRGGVVVGASIDKWGHVSHRPIDSFDELKKLQKSKYVQSDTQGIYRGVETALLAGRQVLFSGCPCQIAALRLYLKKDYDDLITMDLICHGVPSPGVWEEHVGRITQGNPAESITFRRKDSTARTTFSVDIDAYQTHYRGRDEFDDPYMALFVTGSANRESCYICDYASANRVGDITVGDCASSNCYPEFYPWIQLSSVSLNTEKGAAFWNDVKESFTAIPIDYEREIHLNAQLSHPVARPSLRDSVYKRVAAEGLASVSAGVTSARTLKTKLKRAIKLLVPNGLRGRLIMLKAKLHGR